MHRYIHWSVEENVKKCVLHFNRTRNILLECQKYMHIRMDQVFRYSTVLDLVELIHSHVDHVSTMKINESIEMISIATYWITFPTPRGFKSFEFISSWTTFYWRKTNPVIFNTWRISTIISSVIPELAGEFKLADFFLRIPSWFVTVQVNFVVQSVWSPLEIFRFPCCCSSSINELLLLAGPDIWCRRPPFCCWISDDDDDVRIDGPTVCVEGNTREQYEWQQLFDANDGDSLFNESLQWWLLCVRLRKIFAWILHIDDERSARRITNRWLNCSICVHVRHDALTNVFDWFRGNGGEWCRGGDNKISVCINEIKSNRCLPIKRWELLRIYWWLLSLWNLFVQQGHSVDWSHSSEKNEAEFVMDKIVQEMRFTKSNQSIHNHIISKTFDVLHRCTTT